MFFHTVKQNEDGERRGRRRTDEDKDVRGHEGQHVWLTFYQYIKSTGQGKWWKKEPFRFRYVVVEISILEQLSGFLLFFFF